MNKELTFEKLPEAISTLLSEVKEIKSIVTEKGSIEERRIPISIDEACRIINKAKPTIYTMVREGRLKAYKKGKRLYFFEEDLIEWIQGGKLKTNDEIKKEALKYFNR